MLCKKLSISYYKNKDNLCYIEIFSLHGKDVYGFVDQNKKYKEAYMFIFLFLGSPGMTFPKMLGITIELAISNP